MLTVRSTQAFLIVATLVMTSGIAMAADKMSGKATEKMPSMEEMSKMMPKPTAEHQWLQQFVGEWTTDGEFVGPDKKVMKAKGEETVTPIGAFWTTTDIKSTMMNQPYNGKMILGYDTDKKKYVGTWTDSMNSYMWQYEGTVDPSGKILTLDTAGPCPMKGGKMVNFKETIEIKDEDHHVYNSAMQNDNGQWEKVMTINVRRK